MTGALVMWVVFSLSYLLIITVWQSKVKHCEVDRNSEHMEFSYVYLISGVVSYQSSTVIKLLAYMYYTAIWRAIV